jgi:tetratricopeptide (TPR) repeat protein
MTGATAAERSPLVKWLVVGLLALAAIWGVEQWVGSQRAPDVLHFPDTPFSANGLARTYAEAVQRANRGVADARALVEASPDQWLLHEGLAAQYLARAQLTGSYDDYAAAQRALDDAFRVATPGSGPHMLRARLDFSMHRLAAAETQLAAMDRYAVPPEAGERADITAMRGDIAFYSGKYDRALALYDQADALVPGATQFRRAIHAARTGNPDQADALFAAAASEAAPLTPQTRAYFELQRGILDLDRRRLDAAMAHFRNADRLFPGYWLIEEHIAEVLTLQGKAAQAEPLYRDIVRRTGSPEFIDALAGIAAARGDTSGARKLYDQANAIWETRLKQFPESAYGHGFDHCLAKGDWPCALRLAQQNRQARPFGEADVMLARAQFRSGQAAAATRTIEAVLATPWRTVDLHRTAAEIYRAQGMADAATAQDRLAQALIAGA